jgi:hypothetical protein
MTYRLVTDDVPRIPAARSARIRYPFSRMKVGQMAEFPAPNNLARINRAAHGCGAYYGWRFTVRRQPDGSIRVWRTA